jgi:serine/threonine protein phosphatase PrpC
MNILGDTLDSIKNKDGSGGGNALTGEEGAGADCSGCTANVIMNEDRKRLVIANSGDSRSVLCRSGKAIELSFDHKPDNEIERNRIEKAGSTITAGRVDGNLNLSRALGDLRYKRKEGISPEEQPITANPDIKVVDQDKADEFIIMGCDGIWEKWDNQQMVDWIKPKIDTGMSLEKIVEDLLHTLLSPNYTETGKSIINSNLLFRGNRM